MADRTLAQAIGVFVGLLAWDADPGVLAAALIPSAASASPEPTPAVSPLAPPAAGLGPIVLAAVTTPRP